MHDLTGAHNDCDQVVGVVVTKNVTYEFIVLKKEF